LLQVERAATVCREVQTADELAAHYFVRHRVFVEEQRIFVGSDRDGHDSCVDTIHVVGLVGPIVGGAVRLYPLDAGAARWQGDRLAVLAQYRALGLGAPLVRHAVRTAGSRGGQLMVAHIQLSNVTFFKRLGWRVDGAVETYAGLPHQPMVIDLT
jgi:putative N-acetyltransferase (TIGR04045 family)